MATNFWIFRWQHHWYVLRIAVAVTIAVSVISTFGRLLSRRMKRSAFLPDDWLILAALVVSPRNSSYSELTMEQVVAVSASTINIRGKWNLVSGYPHSHDTVVSVYIDRGAWNADDDNHIQKWAFFTQLHWIVAIALTTHSYIAFLWRYFTDAPQGRKLRYCHLLVGLWALGSVSGWNVLNRTSLS